MVHTHKLHHKEVTAILPCQDGRERTHVYAVICLKNAEDKSAAAIVGPCSGDDVAWDESGEEDVRFGACVLHTAAEVDGWALRERQAGQRTGL